MSLSKASVFPTAPSVLQAAASYRGPHGWGLAGLPSPGPRLEAPWGFSQVRCHLRTLRHLLPEVLGGLWTKGLGLNLVRQGEIGAVWLHLWVIKLCMYSWSLLSAGSIFEDLVTKICSLYPRSHTHCVFMIFCGYAQSGKK